MSIDSHQHFWRYDAVQYPWIQAGTPLQRDWLPADWRSAAAPVGVTGSVAVQARQSTEESDWLLSLADANPSIQGVVGWVDLRSACVENDLARLAAHPKFVGVRHVVQEEPDSQFMLQPLFLEGISRLKQFNLTYDFLVYPKQLPAALAVARQFPEQPFVVDHIAKPLIRSGLLKPWREDMKALGKCPNVLCKVSGLVTEAKNPGWAQGDFRSYLDIVTEAFGAERLMFGSDWPVCLLAASYPEVHAIVADYFRQFSAEAQEKFFGQTATQFYGLAAAR
jgi:L-fuconolactonase